MTERKNNLPASETSSAGFFLKTGDGSEYGPVDRDTLLAWCHDGRIEPDHGISEDQQEWVRAADWPDLEMDWILILANEEEVGPFNRQVLDAILASKPEPFPMAMWNRRTDERMSLSQPDEPREGVPAEQAPPAGAEREPEEPGSTEREPDAMPLPEPISEPEQASGHVAEEASEAGVREPDAAADAAAAREAEEASGLVADHAPGRPLEDQAPEPEYVSDLPASTRIEMLNRQTADLREQLSRTRAEHQALRTEFTLLSDQNQHLEERLGTAETERATAESMLLEQQNLTAQHATEVENLNARLDQMQEHYERLQLENQRQFEQIDDMRATALRKEQNWKQEFSLLQAQRDAKSRILTDIADVLAQGTGLPDSDRPVASREPDDGRSHARPVPAEEEAGPAPQPTPQAPTPPASPPANPPMPRLRSKPMPPKWLLPSIILGFILLAIGLGMREGCGPTTDATPGADEGQRPITDTDTGQTGRPGEAAAQSTDEALTLQPEDAESEAARNSTNVATLRAWPEVSLPRATIAIKGKTMRLVFSYGLFEAGTRLRSTARSDLLALAEQLQGNLDAFTITVEGHTDTTPIRADQSVFVDNFALGMARAEAVKHYLAQQGGLPVNKIKTASAGQTSPPHPNDTAENRVRNRTAVIRIIQ